MKRDENVGKFVKEYRDLLTRSGDSSPVEVLVNKHKWSPEAAEHLLWLASKYGSFMLRNALAVSLTLGIEDGELGF